MPSYRYQFRAEEFEDLISFLKTLNARPAAAGKTVAGKDLFAAFCGRCHEADGSNPKAGGSLEGLFQKEKLGSGKPVTDANVLELMDEGHGAMTGTKNWLDAAAAKTLLAYVKSL